MMPVSQVNKGREPHIAVAERLNEHGPQTRAPGVYPSDLSSWRADRTFLPQSRGAISPPKSLGFLLRQSYGTPTCLRQLSSPLRLEYPEAGAWSLC